jgi:hypothetical protein
MQIKHLYAGSWVPRTGLHLKELKDFLEKGASHLNLDDLKLKKLWRNLEAQDVRLEYDPRRQIKANSGPLQFSCHENGLIVIEKKYENLSSDIKIIGDFSLKKLFPAFSYLYSLGAPVPKIFTSIFSIMPFILTLEKGTDAEIKKIFSDNKNACQETIKDKDRQLYLGQEMIVINENSTDCHLIEDLVFIEDIKTQFHKILNLHRFIWEEVDKVREAKHLPYKKLASTRDTLMSLSSEVTFFESRLSQINYLLAEYLKQSKNNEQGKIGDYLKAEYESLRDTGNYLADLWKMTENNVKNALELVTLLYQESTQKELNILQIFFIISAMGSLIALGSIYGFNFQVFNNLGEMVYHGDTVSFTFFDLGRFAFSAILAGIIFYFTFYYIYNRLSRPKLTDPKKLENEEMTNISRMMK